MGEARCPDGDFAGAHFPQFSLKLSVGGGACRLAPGESAESSFYGSTFMPAMVVSGAFSLRGSATLR